MLHSRTVKFNVQLIILIYFSHLFYLLIYYFRPQWRYKLMDSEMAVFSSTFLKTYQESVYKSLNSHMLMCVSIFRYLDLVTFV